MRGYEKIEAQYQPNFCNVLRKLVEGKFMVISYAMCFHRLVQKLGYYKKHVTPNTSISTLQERKRNS